MPKILNSVFGKKSDNLPSTKTLNQGVKAIGRVDDHLRHELMSPASFRAARWSLCHYDNKCARKLKLQPHERYRGGKEWQSQMKMELREDNRYRYSMREVNKLYIQYLDEIKEHYLTAIETIRAKKQ